MPSSTSRYLVDSGLMESSVVTMMHAAWSFVRFPTSTASRSDPAAYARLPKSTATSPERRAWIDLTLSGSSGSQTLTVSPRRPGVLAQHQRAQGVRSRSGSVRGLRRDPARPPSAPIGRQGQQARHHTNHRACPPRLVSLPQPAHHRTLILRPISESPIDRDDAYRMVARDREGRRHSTAHQQPALPAARRHHQRARRTRTAPRRPDPGPARRPPHYRALRPARAISTGTVSTS